MSRSCGPTGEAGEPPSCRQAPGPRPGRPTGGRSLWRSRPRILAIRSHDVDGGRGVLAGYGLEPCRTGPSVRRAGPLDVVAQCDQDRLLRLSHAGVVGRSLCGRRGRRRNRARRHLPRSAFADTALPRGLVPTSGALRGLRYPGGWRLLRSALVRRERVLGWADRFAWSRHSQWLVFTAVPPGVLMAVLFGRMLWLACLPGAVGAGLAALTCGLRACSGQGTSAPHVVCAALALFPVVASSAVLVTGQATRRFGRQWSTGRHDGTNPVAHHHHVPRGD
mgnify:FL=1